MAVGLLGRKVGMTQVFDSVGKVIPVTVIQAGPCPVLQVKTPDRDGYEAVIEPLERALREIGVRNVVIGGSRKVTEELHLLPNDRQIGQSGVSVNPRLLLAIGISGAPQHLNYIGGRATIVAFNRDPEAPLMTLNQRQSQPRVFPVVGDLFETVPALIAALRHQDGQPVS